MDTMEIKLSIQFSADFDEESRSTFWDLLISKIEEMKLRAGGGQQKERLNWVIDIEDSPLSKSQIIDNIGDFLIEKDDLISHFQID